jgi:5-methylcytosine-specific restriction endonuclease McrA
VNNNFIDETPTAETCWRSIILLGKNTASYKFALGKALLELNLSKTSIELDELALPFAKNICKHLNKSEKQITTKPGQFLKKCISYNNKEINDAELKEITIRLGFQNVIDAFHTVTNSSLPIRFFNDQRRKNNSITLTDEFYKLCQNKNSSNLAHEVESRWNLWETAISINISPKLIEINASDDLETLYSNDNLKRIDITSSRNAISGYQKGRCFYCGCRISLDSNDKNFCDIDHFFPHMLKKFNIKGLDQVWNLVLACKECNRGANGKLERIPDKSLLEKLHNRNNYFIESHHPLRQTIMNQTGMTLKERINFLQDKFKQSVKVNPTSKWLPKTNHKEDE